MKTGLIAVIDDDELDRYIYKKIILLTCPSFRFISFSSGIEALAYLRDNAVDASKLPDIILFDLRMPFLNGWQYLEKYCDLKPALAKYSRHYVCTSSMESFDIDFKSDSLYGYFMKPILPENILKIVKETEYTD